MPALKEELGDLLLQVVYHAQMAREAGAFGFADVAAAIADKMVDRHPHVFGDARVATAEAQTVSWEARKAAERAAKQAGAEPAGALDGVARALPALLRAEKIQKRAARVGFDWKQTGPVIDKIEEELGELRAELAAGTVDQARLTDELGDVLFAVANLARHCKVDPEAALRATNDKFERRFRHIERRLAEAGPQARRRHPGGNGSALAGSQDARLGFRQGRQQRQLHRFEQRPHLGQRLRMGRRDQAGIDRLAGA